MEGEFESSIGDELKERLIKLMPGHAFVFRIGESEFVTMTRETIDTLLAQAGMKIKGTEPFDLHLERFTKPQE